MQTESIDTVERKITPHEATAELVPEFVKIAKEVWPSGNRDLQFDLVQEMVLSCLTMNDSAPVSHFLTAARRAALMYLRREKRQEQAVILPDNKLTLASDLQHRFAPNADPAEFDYDDMPKAVPLPKHPVFRILSQAV